MVTLSFSSHVKPYYRIVAFMKCHDGHVKTALFFSTYIRLIIAYDTPSR